MRSLLVTVASALLLCASDVATHGMHGMHEMADSTTEYKCPSCRMSTLKSGYNNANYVELINGQRVYTCGMDARNFPDYTFKSTDAAYIAANLVRPLLAGTDRTCGVGLSVCVICVDNRPSSW